MRRVRNRVYFSLTTNLLVFWLIPFNFAFLSVFAHVIALLAIGAKSTIPLIVSFVFSYVMAAYLTKKDPNWFEVLLGAVRYYKKDLSLFFKKRVIYYA